MIPLKVRSALTVLYQEPQRHYHTLTHVQHCLREFYELCPSDKHGLSNDDISAMELAIWFHDAVYDPRAAHGDNERDSAHLAAVFLRKGDRYSEQTRDMVNFMISATANHFHKSELDRAWLKSQPPIQYFLDIDLSILGASRSDYEAYAKNIFLEYSFVPKRLYNEKRVEILQSFLMRPYIYNTEYFRSKYEVQARLNIQWEIDTLSLTV